MLSVRRGSSSDVVEVYHNLVEKPPGGMRLEGVDGCCLIDPLVPFTVPFGGEATPFEAVPLVLATPLVIPLVFGMSKSPQIDPDELGVAEPELVPLIDPFSESPLKDDAFPLPFKCPLVPLVCGKSTLLFW
jgi:hypothetical protein